MKEMESRRQQVLQKKFDEEKARIDVEKKLKEDEKRKREREDAERKAKVIAKKV